MQSTDNSQPLIAESVVPVGPKQPASPGPRFDTPPPDNTADVSNSLLRACIGRRAVDLHCVAGLHVQRIAGDGHRSTLIMAKEYKLRSVVGPESSADPDDVWALKQALQKEGLYSTPKHGITPFPDRDLFAAIRGFQSQKGLRVDGVAKPGGETEREMQEQLLAVAKFRCIICTAWHGGLYSPLICHNCWIKAAS